MFSCCTSAVKRKPKVDAKQNLFCMLAWQNLAAMIMGHYILIPWTYMVWKKCYLYGRYISPWSSHHFTISEASKICFHMIYISIWSYASKHFHNSHLSIEVLCKKCHIIDWIQVPYFAYFSFMFAIYECLFFFSAFEYFCLPLTFHSQVNLWGPLISGHIVVMLTWVK